MRSTFVGRSFVSRALALLAAAPFAAAIASFALGASGGCSVGDQKCGDDTLDTDLDDACPYGPPGGPQKPKDSSCQRTIEVKAS